MAGTEPTRRDTGRGRGGAARPVGPGRPHGRYRASGRREAVLAPALCRRREGGRGRPAHERSGPGGGAPAGGASGPGVCRGQRRPPARGTGHGADDDRRVRLPAGGSGPGSGADGVRPHLGRQRPPGHGPRGRGARGGGGTGLDPAGV